MSDQQIFLEGGDASSLQMINQNFVEELTLSSYRNFKNNVIQASTAPTLIIGPNGVGKTNILEAISLLSPGRGLRGAKLDEIINNQGNYSQWGIRAKIQSPIGHVNLTTEYQNKATRSKRIIKMNDRPISSEELNSLLSVSWLTPQMDGLFIASPSERRKFFDKIANIFDHEHSKNLHKYEYYIKERMQILQNNISNEAWLRIIEEKIAALMVIIAYSRMQTIEHLQKAINNLQTNFPKAFISIEGEAEKLIASHDSNKAEQLILDAMRANREADKIIHKTQFGTHKTDFVVYYNGENKRLARSCSTGEQKSLLISLILAEIMLSMQWNDISPIILLDEVAVHLDQTRREELLEWLLSFNLQCWITSTDLSPLNTISDYSQIIHL